MPYHPFFDAVSYPFGTHEADSLHVALYRVVTAQARIDHLYQRSGGVGTPYTAQSAELAWREVLKALCAEGRLKHFCDTVFDDPQMVTVQPAITALRDLKSASRKAVQVRGPTFIGRKNLRYELERLISKEIDGVLLVRGASGSGKSWSQKLIRNVSEELGVRNLYLFAGQVFTLEDVFDQLFTTLGGGAAPPKLGSESAWFANVCLKLQNAAQTSKAKLWIVVDDLGHDDAGPLLDPKILDFFKHFGLNMANPAFAEWFRLILLDYPDEPPPTRWTIAFGEDRPDQNEVDATLIKDYITTWAETKDKKLGAERADELAGDIVAKANTVSSAQTRLAHVRAELEGVLRTL